MPGLRLARLAQLRFNWVPASAVDPDDVDDLRSSVRRVVDLHVVLDAVAGDAMAALERLTPQVGRSERGAVLALRRDVFNGRSPRSPLPPAAAAEPAVVDWVAARWELDTVRAKLTAATLAVAERERRALREACGSPRFVRALSLTSRPLTEDVRRYANATGSLSGRLARSEPTILRYLDRARLRTSPFGWYTSTALLRFEDGAAALPGLDALAGATAHVEAGHAVLRRLVDALARHPRVRPALSYTTAQPVAAGDGTMTFEVRADQGHPRIYGGADDTVSVRDTPALRALVAWFGERREQASWQEMVALVASWGSSITPEAAGQFLGALVDARLLRPVLPLPEQDPDLLASVRGVLHSLPGAPGAEELRRVADALARVTSDDLDARLAALSDVTASFDDAFRALDATPPDGATLLYENTVVPDVLPIGTAPWQAVADDAVSAAVMLEAFDRSYSLRALIRDELVAEVGPGGRCDDLHRFREIVNRAMARWGAAILHGDPETDDALAAMAAVRHELVEEYLRCSRSGVADMEITGDQVHRFTERLAPLRARWTSYSLFLQPVVGPDGEVRCGVLNHFYNGLSAYATRFLTATDPSYTDAARERLRALFPADDVVAELRPTCGFNANLHPLLAEVDLDVDGHGAWPLDRLAVRHDEVSGDVVVVDRETGRTVHVLYLGFLVPFMLPSAWSALYTLSSRGPVLDPFGAPAEAARTPEERAEVRAYPRVTLGRVVLRRRRWFVPLARLREVVGDTRDEETMVRLVRWAGDLGIPDEVFFRPQAAQTIVEGESVAAQIGRNAPWNREKPRYLRFTSPLRVRAFATWLARAGDGDVVVEEALPAPCDAPVAGPGGRYVAEVVLEVDRG